MKVTDIMRRKVLSVDSASDSYEAGKLMLEGGGCVLVENNDTVIGIITLRDFVKGSLEYNTNPSEIRVRHIMSTEVHMIDSDATLEKAADLMSSKEIGRLPVLKEDKIIGMIYARDIARLEIAKKIRDSEHRNVTMPPSQIP